MPYSNSLIYADPIDAARGGRKRHAYEDTGSAKVRLCGTSIDGNDLPISESPVRMEATEFATLPNACLSCVDSLSLMPYRENNTAEGSGADAVDYDPFGVFAEEPEEENV